MSDAVCRIFITATRTSLLTSKAMDKILLHNIGNRIQKKTLPSTQMSYTYVSYVNIYLYMI